MIARPPDGGAGRDTAAEELPAPPRPEPASPLSDALRRLGVGGRPRRSTVLAFLAGALLGPLILLLVQALSVRPSTAVGTRGPGEGGNDLVLTLQEPYLSLAAQQRLASIPAPIRLENVRVDVLPGERVVLLGEAPFMGQRFEVSTLMTVGVVGRRVHVDAGDVQLGNLTLPIDVDGLLAQPINQELGRMVDDGQFDVAEVTTGDDRIVVRLTPTMSSAAPR
jgi:hypothetical protein